jgi:outer membrane protein assembly factor BamB
MGSMGGRRRRVGVFVWIALGVAAIAPACGSRTTLLGPDDGFGEGPNGNGTGAGDSDGGTDPGQLFGPDGAPIDRPDARLPDGALIGDGHVQPADPCPITPGLKQGAPWPMFRRCPLHTGRTLTVGPATANLRWTFTTTYAFQASVAIDTDGTIYAGSDNLYAINPDGTLKWSFTMDSYVGTGGSPTIAADGTIYCASDKGTLYAVNPDGSMKWTLPALYLQYSPVLIGPDNTLYIGSTYGRSIYAINSDGTVRWQLKTGNWQRGSPAMVNGTIYVGSDGGVFYALAPDGTQMWTYPMNAGYISQVVGSAAIGTDGTIFQGADDFYLYALKPNGALKWKYDSGAAIQSSVGVGEDGTLYFLQYGLLVAVGPDGKKRWSLPVSTTDNPTSSPAIDGEGTLYILAPTMLAVRSDGTVKWKYDTHARRVNDATPAIGPDGTVYVGSADGNLYAFGN